MKMKEEKGTSLMQPHRTQIPAPNGQARRGVDLPANVYAHGYEHVGGAVNAVHVGRYGHDVELCPARAEALDGLYGRRLVGKHAVERGRKVTERLYQFLPTPFLPVAGLCADGAAYEALVGPAGGMEILAEERVPIGEDREPAASAAYGSYAYVGVINGGERLFPALAGIIGKLGYADPAHVFGERPVGEPSLAAAQRDAGRRRKERAQGEGGPFGAHVAGIVALVAHKVQYQFGVGHRQRGQPAGQSRMAFAGQALAQPYKRRLGHKTVDDGVKHGQRLAAVTAALQHAGEQVDGALLHGAQGLAVALGVMQAHYVQAPHVGYGDGHAPVRIKRLDVEHQPPLAVEARKIALAALQRPVDYFHNLVRLVGLGVEGVVRVRALKYDDAVSIVLVEILEQTHLPLGHGKERGLCAVLPLTVVDNGSLGIVFPYEIGHCLLRGEHEHEAREQHRRHVATAAAGGAALRTIYLKDVLNVAHAGREHVGKLTLLARLRAHHIPTIVNVVELVAVGHLFKGEKVRE